MSQSTSLGCDSIQPWQMDIDDEDPDAVGSWHTTTIYAALYLLGASLFV